MTVLIILLSGLWSLGSSSTLKHPYHSMKYHYVNLNKTWTEAQQYCRDNFVDLATLENEDDMAAMISVTGNSAQFWIGFRGRWAWSLDESTFRKWAREHPHYYTEESCAMLHASGIWTDFYCTEVMSVLCYRPSNESSSNQYIVVDTPMTWFEGQKYCRENYTDLATIRNKEENNNAFSLLDSSLGNKSHAWIGLHRNFSWSDNSTSSFRMWTGGNRNPGGDVVISLRGEGEKDPCASVLDRKWISVDCSKNTLPFVCYEVVPDFKKRVVKIELSPAGLNLEDLNNADTQDALLKQIKEKMEAQGHHGDLKIRWKIQPDGKIFHKKTPDVTPDVCEDD